MSVHVLDLGAVGRANLPQVGGKGANLGELSRLEGIRVPAGFCVTVDAFRRMMTNVPAAGELIDRLARLEAGDLETIRTLSAELRESLESIPVPDDVAGGINSALRRLGEHEAYAVRSSATAEDLPTASFAGQQDTYLNVVGPGAILHHVRRCWASLFTERAVIYRLRNGIDERKVAMAVVVQRMVYPRASGILFTADPVTGNRKVSTVEANFGLGEALVSGRVNADSYRVRDDRVAARTIGTKELVVQPSPDGGTQERAVEPERREAPVLTDAEIIRLTRLGRRIEAHFGSPQDIEWCLVDDDFQIVQSRPITTLFPIPAANDGENRVYLSVGHQQMMTEAMRPLGISIWQLTSPAPMREAGGRLFVDVTARVASPTSRDALMGLAGRSDPLIRDALQMVLAREDFIHTQPDEDTGASQAPAPPPPLATDPAVVAELIERSETSLSVLRREIRTRSGGALLDFILDDIQELRRILFDPQSHQAIMASIEAAWWLNERLESWLGEKNAADTLTQSVSGNVTSEMGLALLDVADVVRARPAVVEFLRKVDDDGFLEKLDRVPGGREARDAIQQWLEKYGMRCVGEIDITRPRWSERPSTLVPPILGNVRNFEAGEAERRFERGLREASSKQREILDRLRGLPEGDRKAEETSRMIDRVRTFAGYREYPKYAMISRYFVYKEALLEEADRLVREGVLHEREDIFYLRFEELYEVVRTRRVDQELVRRRMDEFRWHRTLTPPRVLTSEGEAVAGSYRREDAPAGALVGLPVSAGTVEGPARVLLDMADADLQRGDILVTPYTDPSWTPLFVAIGGLVTEVGGLMTHGAVIAREYGLPAVVGVEDATRRIRNGQWIRVHGTEGYVEVLSEAGPPGT